MSDAFKLSRAALDDGAEEALSPLCRRIIDGEHQDVRPRRSPTDETVSELAARVLKLEAASKRASKKSTAQVSRKDFEFAIETIGRFVGKEINPILRRIEQLESRAELKWAGTWFDGMNVREGELVTDRGSLWLCTSPTHDRPGDNVDAFRLIVKNGSHSANGMKRHATAIRD